MNEKKKTGYLLKIITDVLVRESNHMLKKQDLTWAQSRLIGFLSRNGGECTQKELESFLEVSHPTVVGIVSRMEQNGFVTCRIDASERTSVIRSAEDPAMVIMTKTMESIIRLERVCML